MLFAFSAFAARTDTIYLKNGDRITGEIKSMNQNRLNYKTDRAGTITVEWPSVAYIYSESFFDIILSNNERLFGSFKKGLSPGFVIIKLGKDEVEKNIQEIISIQPIKNTFFERITGNLTLSSSYAKANESLQLNGAFKFTYRSRKLINTLSSSTVINQTATTDQTQRSQSTYSFYILHNARWFSNFSLNYEKNTELNINDRYLLNTGIGNYLVRKPWQELYVLGGLSGNRERSIEEPVTETNNLEFLIQGSYHQFKFRDPQIDLSSMVSTYVSLTNPGRVRFDIQVVLLWELFNNFKWNVTLYDNFDSRVPGTESVNNDWSILTGITYSLN